MQASLLVVALLSQAVVAAVADPVVPDPTDGWPQSGWSLEYGHGVMEHSAAHNHIGWVAGIQGYTSVPDCRHLGDLVEMVVGHRQGLWRVADCTKRKDLPALRNWHHLGVAIVAEVWQQTALQGGWDTYWLDRGGHAKARVLRFISTGYHPGR